ncbi:MAG: hypothetical protein GX079_02320 [Tissierellia bacterium]|nr:hypothetical protein [Tissierellia bacterium]
MKKWSKNERVLIVITLILLVLLSIKSLFIDGYVPSTEEEKVVKELALEKFKVNRFSTFKVVKIKQLSSDNFDSLDLEHGYIVVIRKYLFGIVPYGETRILK